jgi:uncharacterized protein YjbJ (UPF0337 family)
MLSDKNNEESTQNIFTKIETFLNGLNLDLEDFSRNKDKIESKLKQIRGEAKSWWGTLTVDDLFRDALKFDNLTGLLLEKYGYTREKAANENNKRLAEFSTRMKLG